MDFIILKLYVTSIVAIILGTVNTDKYYCDVSNDIQVREGNLGQTNKFPWLGVLRVPTFRADAPPTVAVTGVVLVKTAYALVNAHDVSLIPMYKLQKDARVQFFPNEDEPVTFFAKGYTVHPEYGPITFNTVALLELDLFQSQKNDLGNLKPICWTDFVFNASTYLYAVGFTDENKLLEKMIYHMEYTDETACDEFYYRARLSDKTHVPVYFICGHVDTVKSHCVWDNGMALISNATDYFSLIGFGIHGPGCAAPSRFISLQHYYDWMKEVTTVIDVYDEGRRSGGFEEVPLHELFKSKPISRAGEVPSPKSHRNHSYPFDTEAARFFNIDAPDNSSITVFPFNQTYESYDNACNSWKTLMYRENFEINAKGAVGHVVFKISLYDLTVVDCTCVKIVMVDEPHTSILYIKEDMNLMEGEAITSSEEVIPNLFKHYPIQELYKPKEKPTAKPGLKPAPNMRPSFLKEFFDTRNVKNYNLYIKFEIKDKAVLKVEMYGKPPFRGVTTTTGKPAHLRITAEEYNEEFLEQKKTRKFKPQDTYRGSLLHELFTQSGFVEEDSDTGGVSLYGVVTHKNSLTTPTTTKAPTDFPFLRPVSNSSSYPRWRGKLRNFTTPKLSAITSSTTVTTSTTTSSPIPLSTRPKYDKVHMYTRAFTTTTPYPIAYVEIISNTAGSPRSIVELQVTFAKVLCFDILVLLLNS